MKTMEKEELRTEFLPKCRFCTLYCGECSYFNGAKVSYGKNWCGYYKAYSRNASDIACRNFRR